QLVTVSHRGVQDTGFESDRIDHQYVAFPPADRMTSPRRLGVSRVRLHVHVDGASQVHLPVLNKDRVLVLNNAIHRTVEGPVEDDARRLAPEKRGILTHE